jgi:hypothetical protein
VISEISASLIRNANHVQDLRPGLKAPIGIRIGYWRWSCV